MTAAVQTGVGGHTALGHTVVPMVSVGIDGDGNSRLFGCSAAYAGVGFATCSLTGRMSRNGCHVAVANGLNRFRVGLTAGKAGAREGLIVGTGGSRLQLFGLEIPDDHAVSGCFGGVCGVMSSTDTAVEGGSVLLTGRRRAACYLVIVILCCDNGTTTSVLLFVLRGVGSAEDVLKRLRGVGDGELGLCLGDGLGQLGSGEASVTALTVPMLNVTLSGTVGGSRRHTLSVVYVRLGFGLAAIQASEEGVQRVVGIHRAAVPVVVLGCDKGTTAGVLLIVLILVGGVNCVFKLLRDMGNGKLGLCLGDGLGQRGSGEAGVTALTEPMLDVTLGGTVGGSRRHTLSVVRVLGSDRFGLTAIQTGEEGVLGVARIGHTVVPVVILGFGNGTAAGIDRLVRFFVRGFISDLGACVLGGILGVRRRSGICFATMGAGGAFGAVTQTGSISAGDVGVKLVTGGSHALALCFSAGGAGPSLRACRLTGRCL